MKISGISSSLTNSCYINDSFFDVALNEICGNYGYYEEPIFTNIFYKDCTEYNIIKGSNILADDEILINEELYNFDTSKEYYAIFTDINPIKKYKIVGSYKLSNDKVKKYISDYQIITQDINLVGKTYNVSSSQSGETIEIEFEVDKSFNQFYVSSNLLKYSFLNKNNLKIISGDEPTSANEILVNIYSQYQIGEQVEFSNLNLKVVGKYMVDNNLYFSNTFVISDSAKKEYNKYYYQNHRNYKIGYVIDDSVQAKNYFSNKNIKIKTISNYYYDFVAENNKEIRTSSLVLASVLLLICMIYIYFTTRSKLINQIRDVGVYRSIGATRRQMLRKYALDIFVDTSITMQLGYILTVLIALFFDYKIAKILNQAMSFNYFIILLGVVTIYIINIIIGMIPVLLLLRKTPSEINSKYDI